MAPPPRIEVVHVEGWLPITSRGDLSHNAFFTSHVTVGAIGVAENATPQHRSPDIGIEFFLLVFASAFDFDSRKVSIPIFL